MKFILAKKKRMDQIFNEETGKMNPVTIVEAGPCFVSQIKTIEKDGYSAVQVVSGKKKKVSKSLLGHFKKLSGNAKSKEFRIDPESASTFTVGDKLTVASFSEGDDVAVTGRSKGRGFQGVVKRHGFKGSPASHGHKDQLRMPGSIGATDPARVFKGTRMGGHMGDVQVTTTGLTILKVDTDKNFLYIKGAVPGSINGNIVIKGSGDMTIEKSETKVKDDIKKEKPEEKIKSNKEDATENIKTDKQEEKVEKKEEVKA